ncbi:MAG TPA: radical SAM protein, partial [Bacteroidales bacterium]|nr:radical SAM protein [Bacteroidales bacterium]
MIRQAVILSNKAEYGENYHQVKFVDKEKAKRYTLLRSNLLDSLQTKTTVCSRDTKIYSGELSPGCRMCVEGRWSCLFINNKCNAACFYCPSTQDDLSLPSTDNFIFNNPDDYVAYLHEFGFKGASFSGGEPLLSFDRTVEYLRAVRQHFGSDMHIWLYTNGILLTPERAAILASEGLDEIRFDISANRYSIEKIKFAAGKIPVITVEIPAVPEDLALLKEKSSDMVSEGVNHLNLHQLRLTPYNFHKLTGRDYTFLHGTKVTVLDSEMAALEMIRYTTEKGVDLPVNYCSFVYKNRYQALAARNRYAPLMQSQWEHMSSSGYLRSVFLPGDMKDASSTLLARYGDKLLSSGSNIH